MGDELPMSWHVDAMVVALARAAMARGVGLVVPAEPRFAPLVADIVSEYATPREAEGFNGGPQTREAEGSRRMLAFVTFGSSKAASARGSTSKSAFLSAMGLLQEIGMVDETVGALAAAADTYRLRAAVLVGSGGLVTQALRSGTVARLPQHRFLGPAARRPRQMQNQSIGVAEGLDTEFAIAKSRIEHYWPRVGEMPKRQEEAVEPIDFWRYPAYPMYADQVVRQVLDEWPTSKR